MRMLLRKPKTDPETTETKYDEDLPQVIGICPRSSDGTDILIGAGIACEELLEALEGESFPDRYHFREGTPKYGDLQKLVQLGREYDSTEYEVVEAPSARVDTAQEDAQGEVVRERSTCPSGLPFSIYLSGDSFRWNLARFLQDGVRDVTVGSRYYLDLEDVVLQEPDVFVYMIAERYLHELDRIPGYNTQAMTIE